MTTIHLQAATVRVITIRIITKVIDYKAATKRHIFY